jgi:hypothetical protein
MGRASFLVNLLNNRAGTWELAVLKVILCLGNLKALDQNCLCRKLEHVGPKLPCNCNAGEVCGEPGRLILLRVGSTEFVVQSY